MTELPRWSLALLVALALGPTLALIAVHWPLLPTAQAGDYAQYILHAQALIEGRAYTDTGYIFTPLNPALGPRAYPPGLPLTIIPLIAIGGINTVLLRFLMIFWLGVFLAAAGWYFGRHRSIWTGLGVVVMVGVALESRHVSTFLNSDVGFSALVWLTIVAADSERPWSTPRTAGIVLLGFAAMLYRVAGVALIPAFLLWALLNRRTLGPRAFVPPAVWIASGALLAVIVGAGGLLPPGLVGVDLAELMSRVTQRVSNYALPALEAQLYPLAGAASDVYHLIASALVAVGLVFLLGKRPRSFVTVFSVVYLAMLLVTPVFDGRYLWPLYPVIAAALVTGIEVVLLRPLAAPRRGRWAFGLVFGVAVLAAWRSFGGPHQPALLSDPDVSALFTYARSEAARGEARFVFANPRVLTLETGVPAMPEPNPSPHGVVFRELERARITHVAIGSPLLGTPGVPAPFGELVAQHPNRFRLDFQSGPVRAYRFLPE